MMPHQQRVIDEKEELDAKLGKLIPFLASDTCLSLPFDERSRLKRQSEVMAEYSAILGERIAAFGGVFERAYRSTAGMSFGLAVEAMKQGAKVARAGWNGAGMFAYYVPENSYPAQTGVAKQHFGDGALVPYRAYLALKTAQGDVATWAPSCSDALAEDWLIVE